MFAIRIIPQVLLGGVLQEQRDSFVDFQDTHACQESNQHAIQASLSLALMAIWIRGYSSLPEFRDAEPVLQISDWWRAPLPPPKTFSAVSEVGWDQEDEPQVSKA